ncbi:MAG: beta-glucosidase, partial [Mesorhizobium sp.]
GDQGAPDFIEAYVRFAAEAVRVHRSVTGVAPLVCPINEISFFAWAIEVGYFPRVGPKKRGWFKRQLVRAAVAGVKA